MSTILKALERLEKEKQGGAPRPGGAAELSVVRPGVPQEPSRRWLWIAAGVGALALTTVLAVWLRPLVEEPPGEEIALAAERPVPPEAAPGQPTAPTEPVAVTQPDPEPTPATTAALSPVPPSAPAPAAEPSGPAPPAPEPSPTEAPAAPPAPEPAVAPAPPPVAPAPPSDPVQAVVAETTAPAPEPAPSAEPAPTRRAAEPTPSPAPEAARPRPAPPKPRPAPAVARAPEPKVVVERTIWHPDPERRRAWVRLEGRASTELHEGDALGGVAVRRIEPSGVVFVVEGRELRRAVGALP
jgi:hypothetical protein